MKNVRMLLTVLAIGVSAISHLSANPVVSIAKYAGDRKAAVSLTFDDGVQEHYTLVAPQLDKYELKGTFGINGKFMGDRQDSYAPKMTWEEAREMDRNGHEINNHTWSHPNLYDHPEMAAVELALNDSAMIAELGHPATSVFYPYNAYTPEIQKLCDSLYVGARLYQFGLGQRDNHVTRESINEWLQTVVEKGEWGITMSHGIHTAWDQWDEPQILWDFFKLLSEKKDTIWTDTFANVQAYIKQRDASRLIVEKDGSTLTVRIDCPLPEGLFNVPLTLKIDGVRPGASLTVIQGKAFVPYQATSDGILIDADPHGGAVVITGIDL